MASNFINPISYHFYFCGASKELLDLRMIPAVIDSLREIRPYLIALAKISDPWALPISGHSYGGDLTAECVEENFDRLVRNFEAHPQAQISIYHTPRSIPKELRIPLDRKTAKLVKDKVQANTGILTKGFSPEEVCSFLSCPSNDLRNVLYPVKQVKFGFFDFSYVSIPFNGKALIDNDRYLLHQLHIEIPRALCDYMGQRFSLCEAWKQRLKALCDEFEHAVGCIKMDAATANHPLGIMNWMQGQPQVFCEQLTGYAWLTCVHRQQLQTMGGLDQVRSWNVFHEVQSVKNGGALLQLTQDVENISREKNRRMVKIIRPFLRLGENYYDDIPPSFRFELEPEDVLQYEVHGEKHFGIRMPY